MEVGGDEGRCGSFAEQRSLRNLSMEFDLPFVDVAVASWMFADGSIDWSSLSKFSSFENRVVTDNNNGFRVYELGSMQRLRLDKYSMLVTQQIRNDIEAEDDHFLGISLSHEITTNDDLYTRGDHDEGIWVNEILTGEYNNITIQKPSKKRKH
ncbi:hypothetical protein Lal_00020827 [Lupinus albus]|nr:hypothetical protein Lal_00020827 [Lupinus albus]